jgi:hypothetical protein
MPSCRPALVRKLARQLANARWLALHSRPPARHLARGDFDERPWLGNELLVIRATGTCLDVRYVVREPDSRRVWKAWAFPFRPNLTAAELYGWLASLIRQ